MMTKGASQLRSSEPSKGSIDDRTLTHRFIGTRIVAWWGCRVYGVCVSHLCKTCLCLVLNYANQPPVSPYPESYCHYSGEMYFGSVFISVRPFSHHSCTSKWRITGENIVDQFSIEWPHHPDELIYDFMTNHRLEKTHTWVLLDKNKISNDIVNKRYNTIQYLRLHFTFYDAFTHGEPIGRVNPLTLLLHDGASSCHEVSECSNKPVPFPGGEASYMKKIALQTCIKVFFMERSHYTLMFLRSVFLSQALSGSF